LVFAHVTIRASDAAASERFYATVFQPLGITATLRRPREGLVAWDDFALVGAGPEQSATRHLHVGFVAASRAAVEVCCDAETVGCAGH
jgi:catechol 2,3-dioxygenase-like lactoylglutathione lyase family enzyme